MLDETTSKVEPQEERARWVKPTIMRLSAGSAELLTGPVDDNADFS